MYPFVFQVVSSLVVAGASAWFGSWLGVRHALRRLRNEKAFERRLVWYEDTVTALASARDVAAQYALATRQRDAEELAKLAPQMGTIFQSLGDRVNKVVLYAPARTVQRFDALINQELVGLATAFIQTLQRNELYEEFAARTDSLVSTLNRLIFDLAQELRGELGIEKIELSDVQKKALQISLDTPR